MAGVVGTVSLLYLEQRLTNIYDLLMQRGADLETILDINDGMYHQIIRLADRPLLRSITQGLLLVIGIIFAIISIIQIILFTTGSMQ